MKSRDPDVIQFRSQQLMPIPWITNLTDYEIDSKKKEKTLNKKYAISKALLLHE